ncbi:MAG: hypothetical protein KKB62_02715 [Nanoarchaeota archaeon]|nr:hypothetical protein [Nanoarchaeota archaeon]
MVEESEGIQKKNWHDKSYKWILIIPLLIIIGSIFYIGITYSKTGDFINKDISLTGGTSITIYDGNLSLSDLEDEFSSTVPGFGTKRIYEFGTNEQKAVVVETTLEPEEIQDLLEDYLGYELIEGENSDITFTGSILSESFYEQLLLAILLAFSFMSWVVFVIFGSKTKLKILSGILVFANAILSLAVFSSDASFISTFLILAITFTIYFFYSIPSLAVIISAFANILMTLVLVDILGIKMSTAGIVAFLMLIGYSVDTDILLTTRMLKRKEGSLNERIYGAFKTGTTMTLTSFFALLVALIVVQSFSVVLAQIFTILVIGLGFDLLNTWVTNVSILKWHIERREGENKE